MRTAHSTPPNGQEITASGMPNVTAFATPTESRRNAAKIA